MSAETKKRGGGNASASSDDGGGTEVMPLKRAKSDAPQTNPSTSIAVRLGLGSTDAKSSSRSAVESQKASETQRVGKPTGATPSAVRVRKTLETRASHLTPIGEKATNAKISSLAAAPSTKRPAQTQASSLRSMVASKEAHLPLVSADTKAADPNLKESKSDGSGAKTSSDVKSRGDSQDEEMENDSSTKNKFPIGRCLASSIAAGEPKLMKEPLENNRITFRIDSNKATLDFNSKGESEINTTWTNEIRKSLMRDDVDPRAAIAFAAKAPEVKVVDWVKKYRASLRIALRDSLDCLPSREEFERKWNPKTMSLPIKNDAVVYLSVWQSIIFGNGRSLNARTRQNTYRDAFQSAYEHWEKKGGNSCPAKKRGLYRAYCEARSQSPEREAPSNVVHPIIYTKDLNESYIFEALFELAHGIRMCGSVDPSWGDLTFWTGTKFEGDTMSESAILKLSDLLKSSGCLARNPEANALCAVVEVYQRQDRSWRRGGALRYLHEEQHSYGVRCSMGLANRLLGTRITLLVRRVKTDQKYLTGLGWSSVKAWPISQQNIFHRTAKELVRIGFRLQEIWPYPDLSGLLRELLSFLPQTDIAAILLFLPEPGFPFRNCAEPKLLNGTECWICQRIETQGRAKPCKYKCPMILCDDCIDSDHTRHECAEYLDSLPNWKGPTIQVRTLDGWMQAIPLFDEQYLAAQRSDAKSFLDSKNPTVRETANEFPIGRCLASSIAAGDPKLMKEPLVNDRMIFRIDSHKTTLDFNSEGESPSDTMLTNEIRKSLLRDDVDPRAAIALAAKATELKVVELVKAYRAALRDPLRKLLDSRPSREEFERQFDPVSMALEIKSRPFAVYFTIWDQLFGTPNTNYSILGGGRTSNARFHVNGLGRDLESTFLKWSKNRNLPIKAVKRGLFQLYSQWRSQTPIRTQRTDLIYPVIYTEDSNDSYRFEMVFDLGHGIRMCGDVGEWADGQFWTGTKYERRRSIEAEKLNQSKSKKSKATRVARATDNAICLVVEMFRLPDKTWERAGALRGIYAQQNAGNTASFASLSLSNYGSHAISLYLERIYTNATRLSSNGSRRRIKEFPKSGQDVFHISTKELDKKGFQLQVIYPYLDIPPLSPEMLPEMFPFFSESNIIPLIQSYIPRFAIQNCEDRSELDRTECTICERLTTRGARRCQYGCAMRLCAECLTSPYTSHECVQYLDSLKEDSTSSEELSESEGMSQ
jgi:hypothetical protein